MVITPAGTAAKRAVTLGIQAAESVQVLNGLSPADTVITTGAYGLDEGTKVKIGTAPRKPEERRSDARHSPAKAD